MRVFLCKAKEKGEKVIHIGIDPGQTGAIAFLTDNAEYVLDFSETGKTIEWMMSAGQNSGAVAILEAQFPHKQTNKKNDDGSDVWQGAMSTGKLMTNYGRWQGRLEMAGIPFQEVHPSTWRAALCKGHPLYRVKGKSKELSLEVAKSLFPGMSQHLKRKKDHGRADALLIAYYGKKYLTRI